MGSFVPELGQAAFGNPAGEYDLPDIGDACVMYLLDEFNRVASNAGLCDMGSIREMPHMEIADVGMCHRPYYWHFGDDDEPDAVKPNLSFGGVEIRWYKYPGRSMSCNMEMTPDQWASWLHKALKALRDYDAARWAEKDGGVPN